MLKDSIFFLFPQCFQKGHDDSRVVISRDCVVELNKKRKISAIACIRLNIPVEDGKWVVPSIFLKV